jgi:hypothetical protein
MEPATSTSTPTNGVRTIAPGLEDVPGNTPGLVDVPDKLQELIDAIGSQTDMNVSLWKVVESSQKWAMIHQCKRLLDLDEIGRKFGGGEYRMKVAWRTQGATRGRPCSREIDFVLGDAYDAFLSDAKATAAPRREPEKDIDQVLSLAERIAKIGAQGPAAAGGVDSGILGMFDRLIDRMDKMQERTDSKFERLLEHINKPAAAPVDPKQALRDLIDLGKEMGLPVVSQMGGGDREPWLVVAELVAENAGKLLDMYTAAQQSNLAKIKAMADPIARRVVTVGKPQLADPVARKKMVEYLDGKIGPAETDKILKALGQIR